MTLGARFLRRFAIDRRGGVALVVGLALPVLAVLVAGAIDLASLRADRAKIQDVLDGAALRAAEQMSVTEPAALAERTRAYVQMELASLNSRLSYEVITKLAPDGKSVKVSLEGHRTSFFVNLFPPGGWPLHNASTAVPMGQVPLCVLSMGVDSANKIDMKDQAKITANGCLVHSDGDIAVATTALLQASTVQASGLASGRIQPQAQTGAPEIPDPFDDLALRPDTVCTPVDLIYNMGLVPLPAGVHCGNIKVDETATLSLAPGEHYFLSGKLELAKTAKLIGSNVVLIFDKNSDFKFGDASQVNLKGRTTGQYAGFVIATSRKNNHTFEISSTAARELLGTIYIPNATLLVSGLSGSVGDQSAWTVIVAKSIQMTGGSNLVINSDYASSNVPAPEGVGPTLKGARLVH